MSDERPDFETVVKWIKDAPLTWRPAILAEVVGTCVRDKVFQEGGLMKFVDRHRLLSEPPMSSAEAEAAFDAAPSLPISDDEISAILKYVTQNDAGTTLDA